MSPEIDHLFPVPDRLRAPKPVTSGEDVIGSDH